MKVLVCAASMYGVAGKLGPMGGALGGPRAVVLVAKGSDALSRLGAV
jgi:hypothetical protein